MIRSMPPVNDTESGFIFEKVVLLAHWPRSLVSISRVMPVPSFITYWKKICERPPRGNLPLSYGISSVIVPVPLWSISYVSVLLASSVIKSRTIGGMDAMNTTPEATNTSTSAVQLYRPKIGLRSTNAVSHRAMRIIMTEPSMTEMRIPSVTTERRSCHPSIHSPKRLIPPIAPSIPRMRLTPATINTKNISTH